MEFIISVNEYITPEEAKELLSFLSGGLVKKGYTVLYEEVSDLKTKNYPIGDLSLEEETFFQTKIRRMNPKKKKVVA